MDFTVTADHRVKIKESEKIDNYLDLAGELRKLWNMKVTMIRIVIGAFRTVSKGWEMGLEELENGRRTETIQTTALLRSVRILRIVRKTWGDLLPLRLQTIHYHWCEKLAWDNRNDNTKERKEKKKENTSKKLLMTTRNRK